jgi:hypothetical protein
MGDGVVAASLMMITPVPANTSANVPRNSATHFFIAARLGFQSAAVNWRNSAANYFGQPIVFPFVARHGHQLRTAKRHDLAAAVHWAAVTNTV